MEIDNLLDKYFEGETTAEEEQILRDFFRSADVPERLADCKPLFAYFDTEIRKTQSIGNVQPKRRHLFYWAAAASVLLVVGIWQASMGLLRTNPCLLSSGYVVIDGRCYADMEKARAMAREALLQVATPVEDLFPDNEFFSDN